MKTIKKDTEVIIKDLDKEVDVEVDYRCFITVSKAFAPMTVSGSINKKESLQDFIALSKKRYEKDYYKVEVMEVRIDESFSYEK